MICGSGGFKSRLAKAAPRVRSAFGSWDVEEVHVVVARSTFPNQNVQSTSKHTRFGSLFEVEMSKKCTPLWREAHFEVSKWKQLGSSEHFWTFECRFAWQAQGIMHLAKSEQNVRGLWHFLKWWQAWDIWRGSGKMHVAWQAQYKRHVHQRC